MERSLYTLYCKVKTLNGSHALRPVTVQPGLNATRMKNFPFVVSVHDIAPRQAVEVSKIFRVLEPLVGDVISAAVIPCPGGAPWGGTSGAEQLRRLVSRGAREVVAHGWAHRRAVSLDLFSLLIGCCDEFGGLDGAATGELVGRALRGTRALFGTRVRGFVAPAWRSAHAPALVGENALRFVAGWSRLHRLHLPTLPLATWSWDAGPVSALGLLAELTGRWRALWRGAIPVIAIHPADVCRGYLPRAVAQVKRHLGRGGRPVVLEELMGAPEVPC
jgi:predicted deacetylase